MELQYQKLCNNCKLTNKWTTSIEIIDHVSISYYSTYQIFGNFPTLNYIQGSW